MEIRKGQVYQSKINNELCTVDYVDEDCVHWSCGEYDYLEQVPKHYRLVKDVSEQLPKIWN